MDEWTEDEMYEDCCESDFAGYDPDHEDDPCDDCNHACDDSCIGCPEYGRKASLADPTGVYSAGGECVGRVACGCEDYPCCGH